MESNDPFASQCLGALRMVSAGREVPEEEKAAAKSWLLKQGPRAASTLRRALADESPDVRECAAELLGEMGDQDSVPLVIEALADERMFVRQDAFSAILQITGADFKQIEESFPDMCDLADNWKRDRARDAARQWWQSRSEPRTQRSPRNAH